MASAGQVDSRAQVLGLELLQKVDQASEHDLLIVAQQRRESMLRLMSEDPSAALRSAMPAQQRGRFPEQVAEQIEERVSLDGTVKVLIHDFDEHHRVEHRLQTLQGEIGLHFSGQAPALKTGQALRIHGLQLGREMLVNADSDQAVLYLNGDNADSTTGGATLSNTFGEQRVLVLLVNFQNDPGNQPYTRQQAQDLVFGEVDAYYREASSDRTWLSGDVFGWYTMALDQPTDPYACRLSDISSAAQQAAGSAGVNIGAYDRLVYVFPYTSCFASGTATVGGIPSEAWINGNAFKLKTLGHELGHNLGLDHAGSLDCGSSTEQGSCSTSTYGDLVDIMGNKTAGHFNARNKERLGWLDASAGDIVEAGAGSYVLSPYELAAGNGIQALKVLAHTDSNSGEETWYYLEYRQALGYDSFIGEGSYVSDGNLNQGVMLRRVTMPGSNTVGSLLMDMTPDSSSYYEWHDAALVAGSSYTDPVSGLMLSVDWADASGAAVTVGGDGNSNACVAQTPQLQLSSSQSEWAMAGETVQYTLAVTNNDSAACAARGFNLAAAEPQGWSAGFSQSSLLLSPGDSSSVVLSITSSSNAGAGYYDIATTLVPVDGSQGDSALLTYVVESANTAPVAEDDQASLSSLVPLTIDVLGNDWDPQGDALMVVSATQGNKGQVVINGDGSITYTPGKRFKNNDSFSYTISDGQHEATATVSVALQSSGGAGSGGGSGKKGGGRNK